MLQKAVQRPSVLTPNPPVLVLLHGLGSDERDLIGLATELDRRLMIVSFRAPNPYEGGGFAWFDVRWDASGIHADGEGALRSRDVLIEELSTLPAELGIQPSKLILGGFSQGAMMSLGVALSAPAPLAGVMLLSGRLLPQFSSEPISDAFAQLSFFVQHGVLDPVIPIQDGRVLKAFLEIKARPLTYHEFPMAHEINRKSLVAMNSWLTELLG